MGQFLFMSQTSKILLKGTCRATTVDIEFAFALNRTFYLENAPHLLVFKEWIHKEYILIPKFVKLRMRAIMHKIILLSMYMLQNRKEAESLTGFSFLLLPCSWVLDNSIQSGSYQNLTVLCFATAEMYRKVRRFAHRHYKACCRSTTCFFYIVSISFFSVKQSPFLIYCRRCSFVSFHCRADLEVSRPVPCTLWSCGRIFGAVVVNHVVLPNPSEILDLSLWEGEVRSLTVWTLVRLLVASVLTGRTGGVLDFAWVGNVPLRVWGDEWLLSPVNFDAAAFSSPSFSIPQAADGVHGLVIEVRDAEVCGLMEHSDGSVVHEEPAPFFYR